MSSRTYEVEDFENIVESALDLAREKFPDFKESNLSETASYLFIRMFDDVYNDSELEIARSDIEYQLSQFGDVIDDVHSQFYYCVYTIILAECIEHEDFRVYIHW